MLITLKITTISIVTLSSIVILSTARKSGNIFRRTVCMSRNVAAFSFFC